MEAIIIRQAEHDPSRLAIFAPFQFKDGIKALPGARPHYTGDKPNQRFAYWHVPATPQTVLAIRALFKGLTARGDQFFKRLVAEAVASEEAQSLKHMAGGDVPPVPGALKPAWVHQARAYHFAERQRAVMLAMQMGSGKSAVVVWRVANMERGSRVLIVCPRAVVRVWPKQFSLHTNQPVLVTALDKGSVEKKLQAAKLGHSATYLDGRTHVVVINYESLWRDPFADWALKQEWDLVVLDESHKIKSPGGKASMYCAQLSRSAKSRMCLTGTPMPHSPLDVYSQYRFLDPGVFDTNFARFRAEFAIMGDYGNHQNLDWRDLGVLKERMYRIAFRVETRDVLDLPPATHVQRWAELGPKARSIYTKLEKDFIAYLEGKKATEEELEGLEPSTEPQERRAVGGNHVLTRLLRLTKIDNGFARDDTGQIHQVDTGKMDVLEDQLDNLPAEEPVLIFCRFSPDIEAVHKVAAKLGRASLELSGHRNDLAEWQDGKAPILAVQIQAGGAGIDLTRAAYVFYYSIGFNYGDYDQSLARAVRPGQTRPVTIVHIDTEGTVDEKIATVLSTRAALIAAVMAEGSPTSTERPDMVKDLIGLYNGSKAA